MPRSSQLDKAIALIEATALAGNLKPHHLARLTAIIESRRKVNDIGIKTTSPEILVPTNERLLEKQKCLDEFNLEFPALLRGYGLSEEVDIDKYLVNENFLREFVQLIWELRTQISSISDIYVPQTPDAYFSPVGGLTSTPLFILQTFLKGLPITQKVLFRK